MADLKKTIDIVLNGDDRASRQIRRVGDSLGGMNEKFRTVAGVGIGAAAAITAVAAAVTALTAAGLKKAYDQAVLFESAMVDLEKVLGDHPDQLDGAKQAAIELSNQYGVSSDKIVDSLAGWVQAGYDIQEATTLAEESIALMYTSELSAADATVSLKKVMKGFGLEVEEARSKLDALNEISNNYGASTQQLSEALGRVAPAAESMGFSLEEMAAIMTPAIEKFQNGEKIGTAFKTVLGNMVSPTGRVKEGLKLLGITQEDLNTKLTGGRERFDAVKTALGQVDGETKNTAATLIAGKEHFTKFLGAMGDAEYSAQVYETAINSAGSMTEELSSKLDSSEKQLDRWSAAWENLGVSIGDEFKDAATEVVEGGTAIVNALKDSIDDGDFEVFFGPIREGLSSLGDFLKAFPAAVEDVDFSELGQSFSNLADAMGVVSDVDLTNPKELAEVIQDIADKTADAVDKLRSFIEFFQSDEVELTSNALQGMQSLRFGNFKDAAEHLFKMRDAAKEIAKEKGIIVEVDFQKADNAGQQVQDAISSALAASKKDVTVPVKFDTEAADEAGQQVQNMISNAKTHASDNPVEVDADTSEATKKMKKVEDQTDELAEKKIEIDADLKMAKIEAETKRVEALFDAAGEAAKWNAELKTAQVEAEVEKIKAVYESVNTAIESTATSIGDAMSAFGNEDMSFSQKWAVEEYLDAETERRAKAFEQQQELVKQQVKLNDMKIDKMESGESMMNITVDDSVEPALKLVMMNILELMQTEFNEMSDQFLLGWESVS